MYCERLSNVDIPTVDYYLLVKETEFLSVPLGHYVVSPPF